MTPGEKLLALTLEYRDAVESPALAASAGENYRGRTPVEIGAEYEALLRQTIQG